MAKRAKVIPTIEEEESVSGLAMKGRPLLEGIEAYPTIFE